MSVWANFADIYLQGMHDRSLRSGMGLTREIQLTDWSTAGEQGKLVFFGFDQAITGAIYFIFHNGKKLSFNRPNYTSILFKFFTLRFLSIKKGRKEIHFDKQNFFS